MSGRVGLWGLVLAVVLSACGPIPQPFKASPDLKESNPLLNIPDAASVMVSPLTGASAGFSAQLTATLVSFLKDAGIPASSKTAPRKALFIAGSAVWKEGMLTTQWQIKEADGKIIAGFQTKQETSQEAYEKGDADLIQALVDRTGAFIAATLQPDTAARTDHISEKNVAVLGVEGAPGNGNEALSKAMQATLHEAGISLAGNIEDASLTLVGHVDLVALSEDSERVLIQWWLMDREGRVLGTLGQENEVPSGSLSDHWEAVAYDIALANIPALKEILDKFMK